MYAIEILFLFNLLLVASNKKFNQGSTWLVIFYGKYQMIHIDSYVFLSTLVEIKKYWMIYADRTYIFAKILIMYKILYCQTSLYDIFNFISN